MLFERRFNTAAPLIRPDNRCTLMTGLLGFRCISSQAAMSYKVTNPLLCNVKYLTVF